MGKLLGEASKADIDRSRTADSGFFVPEAEAELRAHLVIPKPSAEEVAEAKRAVNQFFNGEDGIENGRRFDAGLRDVVAQRHTEAAETYICVEHLLGIAHAEQCRLPDVSIEQVTPEQPGGVGA